MINRYLFAGFAVLVLTGMRGEDTVPPRAAGLWESKIFQPEQILSNVRLPASARVIQTCVKENDPSRVVSAEESNAMAKLVSCGNKVTSHSGNKLIVEESCFGLFNGQSISRRTYEGDFKTHVTIEYYNVKNGVANLMAAYTERRLGNCPAGK